VTAHLFDAVTGRQLFSQTHEVGAACTSATISCLRRTIFAGGQGNASPGVHGDCLTGPTGNPHLGQHVRDWLKPHREKLLPASSEMVRKGSMRGCTLLLRRARMGRCMRCSARTGWCTPIGARLRTGTPPVECQRNASTGLHDGRSICHYAVAAASHGCCCMATANMQQQS
jgi:hypothetical protein